MNNQNITAIVTGGAQGIGRAIAMEFLKEGKTVIIADSDEQAGRETLENLKDSGVVRFLPTDVSDEKSVMKTVSDTVRETGRIDIVVNNAGLFRVKPVTELTLEEWNRIIGVNLTGAFLMAKHAAPHLKKTRGTIVNIASTRALQSEKDTESYSASKGGIVALTHSLAVSLGPDIRVNCVSPGWIDVSDWKKSGESKQANISDADREQHPAGRVGTPSDIARMVSFLCRPENSFITGANYTVDGGMTRRMIYV